MSVARIGKGLRRRWRDRWRGGLRRRLLALDARTRFLDRMLGVHTIRIQHAPAEPGQPRWGWGRPPHEPLAHRLEAHRPTYEEVLDRTASYTDDLASIPARSPGPDIAGWLNPHCSGLDAAVLYTLLRSIRPATYVEVGSGWSTLFADRARADGALETRIVSIDPHPRTDVARVCDEALRGRLETLELARFDDLARGDIVLLDGSHHVLAGSDVVVFFCEVLPRLPEGVIVGVDDVFWPEDYPESMCGWAFAEQYVLAPWLLAGSRRMTPLLPGRFVSLDRDLAGRLSGLWDDSRLTEVVPEGKTFWFTIGPEAPDPALIPPPWV